MKAQELDNILKSNGIKQTWVAEKLGVTRGAVNQWVKGVNTIPDKYVVELKHILKRVN